jgi:hypothetical protein
VSGITRAYAALPSKNFLLFPDHNAVQHEFLLHLLLFISRSSGTLRSMICLGCRVQL